MKASMCADNQARVFVKVEYALTAQEFATVLTAALWDEVIAQTETRDPLDFALAATAHGEKAARRHVADWLMTGSRSIADEYVTNRDAWAHVEKVAVYVARWFKVQGGEAR